jgi:hypothetical protein
MRNVYRLVLLLPLAVASPSAFAQPATSHPAAVAQGAAPASAAPVSAASKGEIEFLVAPGGSAFEVPIHAGAVCILSFPGEKMESSALASSGNFEIVPWGDTKEPDRVAVRANGRTPTATIALATASGDIKINLTFRVVPEKEDALIFVRFKAVTAEEAYAARLKADVAKQLAPLEAALDVARKRVEQDVRDRAVSDVIDHALKRSETVLLHAHARNDSHVIAHVEHALLLGDDAYLLFEIENRSPAPFRLARAAVTLKGAVLSSAARLRSAYLNKDPKLLGIVAASASAHGVVVIPNAVSLARKSLTLELTDLDGRGAIRVEKGLVLP